MTTPQQKRDRFTNLVAWATSEIDAVTGEVEALKAIQPNQRTDAQKLDLRWGRRFIRLARLVLLLAGHAREADVTGTDG